MRRPTLSFLAAAFVFAIVALGCRSCPPQPPPNNNGNSSPRPGASPSAKNSSNSTVRRVDANVMAGENAPLPLLADNSPHDLAPRTQVNTDPNGEARLELAGCEAVYLFQLSQMTYASCSKSEAVGGGVNCLQGGTAVYNSECAGRIEQVIQTPTANVTPKGTWLVVTYLPDKQLTIVVVLKGAAEVRPVTDMESRTLGEPILVQENQFTLTVPERQADQQDYDAASLRKPKPLSDAPTQLNQYLKPWLSRIKKHAEEDKLARQSFAFTADVDCDCENVEFGLLTREYRLQCIRAEAEIWKRYYETGELGKCDTVAQGPNARPK